MTGMSELSTADFREDYIWRNRPRPTTEAAAEFDEWINRVKAQAFDEGWKARAKRDPLVNGLRDHVVPPPPHALNPYR